MPKRKRSSDENESPFWSESDLLELISKIEENIPEGDALSYTSRLEKLDWTNISFKKHSVKECQLAWSNLLKQVRKFRLLKEVVADMKNCVNNPKSSLSKDHALKHPDRPKQPPNVFMHFVNDKRHEVMEQYPNLGPTDVSKKLGQMFKSLTMKEREKYEAKAQLDKQEYLEKLQDFYEEHPHLAPKKQNKRSKSSMLVEGMGPPEKPKTAFQLYLQVESEKAENEDAKFGLIQKCRERWNDMADRDKLFWINWTDELYDKYMEDLKSYIKVHPDYEPENIKPVLTKKEKRIKDTFLGKPDKPPHSPYHLFTKMMSDHEEMKRISHKDLVNYISEKWKECSAEEKNEYKVRVEQMWEEYHRKLEQYLMNLPPAKRSIVEEEESRKKNRNSLKSPTKSSKEIKKKPLEKPQLPPLTDYKYFLSVYKGKENPSVVWKNMNEKEKKTYQDELAKKKRDYIESFEKYLKSLSSEEIKEFGESLGNSYDTSSEIDTSDDEGED